jgi:hypothetical protein
MSGTPAPETKQVLTLQSGAPAPAPSWSAAPGAVPPPQGITQLRDAAAPGGGADLAAAGSEPASQGMSLPKLLTAVLFLPMVLSVLYLFMGDQLGLALKRIRSTPSASARSEARTSPGASASLPASSASAAPSAALAGASDPAGSAAPAMRAEAPTEPMSSAAAPADGATAPLPSAARAADSARPGAGDAPVEASGNGKGKPADGKSLQREAADAVAAGAFARAAKLYEELARKYPNKPAYAEAALIMRAKAAPSE